MSTTKNDVKQLAEKIEVLAKDVQSKLDTNGDWLGSANELTRNNLTFVFTLGEYFALQQVGTAKTVKATSVSVNRHALRDPSTGRWRKA